MEIRTPLLIDVSTTFEEYISRLSLTDKKKFKSNKSITSGYKFDLVQYDPFLMRKFITLWETQTVYGGLPIKWYRPMEFMDALDTLIMFKVSLDDEIIGLHCFEKCDQLAYGHPPLYDKKKFPNLARFSWFSMIKHCCNSEIKYLDMDGGSGRDWRTLLLERHNHENLDPRLLHLKYKWCYVPKDVKDDPNKETPYLEFRCSCNWKQLVETGEFFCNGHNRKMIGGYGKYSEENDSPRFLLK